ncbi:3-oxo-5-alpha-steroid 4-dehydrogenase 2-like isoform X2 [Sesamum indicum]|uniref:3-oxo-5-alpha-steroid 4-dehydrogenase 2-like isoform X2 n=1 Tax=Sesamum indicum TaxID=4182 RepID=A0A8M8V3Q8_SESIN|nr:3-oxo-5-alpha-steroid 4-dehydrogenase 2-like isoform X2 [Sesamum indicum]
MAKMLESWIYQEPSSIYTKALYGLTLLGACYLAISEAIGKHLRYSKFWNSASNKPTQTLPSKVGMLLAYTPSLLAGVSSFWVFSDDGGIRFLMLKSAITLHFLKRELEVLFLHKFSGHMVLNTALFISSTYLTSAASMIYIQHRVQGFPEPWVDLKYVGLLVFVVGTVGNFYHHYLLSKLRDTSNKGYTIPRGGLFSLVLQFYLLGATPPETGTFPSSRISLRTLRLSSPMFFRCLPVDCCDENQILL